MNEPKLSPCPHCGDEFPLMTLSAAYGYKIRCEQCHTEFALDCTAGRNFDHDKTVEVWNRRAPLPDNKALTVDKAIAWGTGLIEANTDAHITFCAECGFPIADYGVDMEIYCSWCKAKNTSHNFVVSGPGCCATTFDRKAKTFDKLFADKHRQPEKGD